MKKILSLFAMLALIFAFVGCADPNEPRYTIFVGQMSDSDYSNFENQHNVDEGEKLTDGYYTTWTLSDATYDEFSAKFSNGKYAYTKAEIKDCLKSSFKFGETEAGEAVDEILKNDKHRMIASKRGNVVDILVKR